jgi:hypothetical protein
MLGRRRERQLAGLAGDGQAAGHRLPVQLEQPARIAEVFGLDVFQRNTSRSAGGRFLVLHLLDGFPVKTRG